MNSTGRCGKTRLVLEGLLQNWGLYFVCKADQVGIGSRDVDVAITHVAFNPGWSSELPPENDPEFSTKLRRNVVLIIQALKQVLLARLLIFQKFLELATEGGKPLVAPGILPRYADIFDYLSRVVMSGANMNHVSMLIGETRHQIPMDDNMFCVIDEAQVAAHLWPKAFLSDFWKPNSPRPARSTLQIICQVLRDADVRFIVAGTGVSTELVEEPMMSAASMEPRAWREYCDTEGFD